MSFKMKTLAIVFSLFFLGTPLVNCQESNSETSKNLHIGMGFSPFINFMYGEGIVGDNTVDCFLLKDELQGQPYNFLIQNKGQSYVAAQLFLRYRIANLGSKTAFLVYAPIELGASVWEIDPKHGVAQQCAQSLFVTEKGFGHLTTGVYGNISFGYGANESVTTYKGFGLSLGIERTQSSLFMSSEYTGSKLPDYKKSWILPSVMIDFKLEDRKERFYQVNLKYSMGKKTETELLGGSHGVNQASAYSLSIVRIFGY